MRFTLRDLFWLTLVVAVGCWAYYTRVRPLEQRVAQYQDMSHALQQSALLDHILARGGMRNVHSYRFVYSRWYGAEMEINYVDKTPREKFKLTQEGETVYWPYLTQYGWNGSTMLPEP